MRPTVNVNDILLCALYVVFRTCRVSTQSENLPKNHSHINIIRNIGRIAFITAHTVNWTENTALPKHLLSPCVARRAVATDNADSTNEYRTHRDCACLSNVSRSVPDAWMHTCKKRPDQLLVSSERQQITAFSSARPAHTRTHAHRATAGTIYPTCYKALIINACEFSST